VWEIELGLTMISFLGSKESSKGGSGKESKE